jgi:SAM-dependent methyltransferase
MPAAAQEVFPERYTLPTGAQDAKRLGLLDELYAPATEALLDALQLNCASRVADIGCGCGFMSARLASRFCDGEAVGLDASAAQVEVAAAHAQRFGLSNVRFVVASAYETGLPTAQFDLVFSRAMLCHLQRPMEALAEMRRLLKPGGTLLCEDFDLAAAPIDAVLHPLSEFDARVAAVLGVDFCIGVKLPKFFMSVGIADPQIKLFQPVFLRGEQKRFVEHTYAAHLPFLIEAGVAPLAEIEAHLAALRRLNDDQTQASPQFRLSQVWGRG